MKKFQSILLVLIACSSFFAAQEQKRLITLKGRVVDARTGERIAKVRVIANDIDRSTTTDDDGNFTLEDVPVGALDLYITTVNYGLVKRTVTISEKTTEIEIALNEDAAALTETVTVTADPFETPRDDVISEHTLDKRELQQLASVLVGDPIRAAQALPGVAASDDFRSEFSVRGASFDRVGLYLDGVLTENFVHTVQGGYPDAGSLSVINSDTVDALSLMSGGFPSEYGFRSAAILDLTTRDGNRVKPAGRLSVALSGLSGVVDGPFAGNKGSYLVAGRKSYLGFLIRRINDQNDFTNSPPILAFADVQSKVVYDVGQKSTVGVSVIFGDFNYDRNRDRAFLGVNTVFRGTSRNLLLNTVWSYSPNQKVFLQTRFFGLHSNYKNINFNEDTLLDGERSQFGVRSDVGYTARGNHLQTGLYLRTLRVESFNQFFGFIPGPFVFGTFDRRGNEQAYYAQDTWTNGRHGLSLSGGARLEHSSTTGENLISPRGSISWSPGGNWRIHAVAGRYHQFPDFELQFGRLANPNLRSENSDQYSASVSRLLGDRARVMVELYDREDRRLFFSLSEPRLTGNTVTLQQFPFQNSVHGHARGVELTLQRRSANKLTGWISYAFEQTRLTHEPTGLSFVSDSDQTHTLNVYGSYRFNESWNLSSEWRYGSGQPVPGFYRQEGRIFFLTNQRNTTRLPVYSRVDVRLNKAFLFKKWKLTLNGEVINVLNRTNVRFAGFDGFSGDGRVFGQLDRTLPFLPSAGVVIEF
jgi:CarboxypepD_reg-like domain/TonB-dependent Receptor Plug Domain